MCYRTQDNHTRMFSQSTRYFSLGFNPIQDDTFSQVQDGYTCTPPCEKSTRYFSLGFNSIQDDTFSQLYVTTNPGRLYMLHLKMNKCIHTNYIPFLLYLRIFSQNEKSKHGYRTRHLEHYVCCGNELAAVMPQTV